MAKKPSKQSGKEQSEASFRTSAASGSKAQAKGASSKRAAIAQLSKTPAKAESQLVDDSEADDHPSKKQRVVARAGVVCECDACGRTSEERAASEHLMCAIVLCCSRGDGLNKHDRSPSAPQFHMLSVGHN